LDCIKIIDDLLEDFNFSLYEKHLICERSYHLFQHIENGIPAAKQLLKNRYREHAGKIAQVIKQHGVMERTCVKLLNDTEYLAAIKHIKTSYDIKDLENRGNKIIRDIIHMIFNRYFSSHQNLFELLIYYMMSNFYKSESIRKNIHST
jgi:thiopeptide-type bacteriocin biosynthesis protein